MDAIGKKHFPRKKTIERYKRKNPHNQTHWANLLNWYSVQPVEPTELAEKT
jgi:hypothetical protein